MLEASKDYDVIVLSGAGDWNSDQYQSKTGWAEHRWLRALGPYRVRTFLNENNYSLKVIDFITQFDFNQIENMLFKHMSDKTKFIALNTTYLDPGTFHLWKEDFDKLFFKAKSIFSNIKGFP